MRRVVSLTGMASPRPIPATAVFTPTRWAFASARAPPELPGLRAASVWITSSMTRTVAPARVGSDRPSALTTPAVTLPVSPSGLPTATTSWPTASVAASPSVAGGGVLPRARSTARSDSGSAPITSTTRSVPSVNSAVPVTAFRSLPGRPLSTTWAEVSRKPSSVKTTADPAPAPALVRTRRLATAGESAAATLVTTCE